MRYAVIDPEKQTTRAIDASSFTVALDAAGLGDVGRDYSLVNRHIGIVVFEYGLFDPPAEQHYFGLGGKLFGGNALLYAFNERGETIDLTECPQPRFFNSLAEIEAAIYCGEIARPMQVINDKVIWQWPNPPT